MCAEYRVDRRPPPRGRQIIPLHLSLHRCAEGFGTDRDSESRQRRSKHSGWRRLFQPSLIILGVALTGGSCGRSSV